jgi:Pro-kumamolisin, activation domain
MMKYILSSMCLSQASTYLDTKQLSLSGANLGLGQKYPAVLSQSSFSDIYMKSHRALSDEVFDIVFVMQRGNMREVPSIQRYLSNPSQSGLTVSLLRENLESAPENLESSGRAVSYLNLNGATITSVWQDSEYVTARAPMIVWEKMFHCEFYSFLRSDSDGNDVKVTRTEKYRIPDELKEHVQSVFSAVRELPDTPSIVIGGLRTFLSPIVIEEDHLTDKRVKSRYPTLAPTRHNTGRKDGTKNPVSKPTSDDKTSPTRFISGRKDGTVYPVSKPASDDKPSPTRYIPSGGNDGTDSPVNKPTSDDEPSPTRYISGGGNDETHSPVNKPTSDDKPSPTRYIPGGGNDGTDSPVNKPTSDDKPHSDDKPPSGDKKNCTDSPAASPSTSTVFPSTPTRCPICKKIASELNYSEVVQL